MRNKITSLFKIQYPIVQGGMVWCSGWKLASAVSNCGGLGLLGAGSMYPEVLEEHVLKMKNATNKPWGINIPLLYPDVDKIVDIILKHKVPIVFTSAGSPKKWTPLFKENDITVAHVVSSALFAKKCEDAGVDAVVAEGFEAGGHNGREETTTLTLIPNVRKQLSIPLIAAGGIGSGESMFAAMSLGADGVQIGSLFAASAESSAHENFKNCIVDCDEGSTQLRLKKLAPVRLIKNKFYNDVVKLEEKGAEAEALRALLGRGRAKKGMFEGDMDEGELEIGQISSTIDKIMPVKNIMSEILDTFEKTKASMSSISFE